MERAKPSEETRLRILTEISQQIISILDINELLVQVVRRIQQAFDYYHVGLGLIEKDEVVYRVGAGILWDDPNFQFKPQCLKVGSQGLTGWVAYTGRPVLAPDVAREPRYIWMQGSKTRSELVVPITVKGQTIGVLDVQSDRLNDFNEADLNFLQLLASQAGVAIENARLFAETQRLLREAERRASKLAIANSVQQMLASKFEVASIYEQVGERFRDIFDAQVVVISTYDAATHTVEHRYAIERGQRIPWPGTHPPGGFRSQIIQTRKPLLFNANVAEIAEQMRQPILQGTESPRSWLGAPILVGDQVIGILSVQNLDRENAFDESDMRLLEMFAASMGIALENARLYEQAQQLAVTEERSRLARDLHDSVSQALYGITLYSQAATEHLAAGRVERVADHLRELQDASQDALAEMRLLIFELRPPILAEEGLAAAVQARLLAVEGRAGLKTEFTCELQGRLPPVMEEGLYRIAQEALNNCLRHAYAHRIVVGVRHQPPLVTLTITDDGVGFDVAAVRERGGLGLLDMQERAAQLGGRFSIIAQPGQGAQICVEVNV